MCILKCLSRLKVRAYIKYITDVSRKTVSLSEISAANVMVAWCLLACSMDLPKFFRFSVQREYTLYGRGGGHSCDKAPPSKAVLLQYSPPDVARRTAIALMVG